MPISLSFLDANPPTPSTEAHPPHAEPLMETLTLPLHAAVIADDERSLRALIASGDLAIDERDRYGRSALHYATLYQLWPLVELLSLHGADPLAVDRLGDTPIDLLFLEGDDPLDDDIRYGPGWGRDQFDAPLTLQ